ncbi:glycosyl transferase, partial [Streptomyces sp. A73]|nr:glycosyl transferase [Streptomyces sp. A73]
TLINCNPEKGGHVLRALAQRIPEQQFVAVRGAYGEQVDYDGLANVEVLAQVPGEEMAERVYGRTRVLLMPSSYESWGRAG